MEKEDVIRLASLIEGSVADACKGKEMVGIAFSGGLDSGMLAHLAQKYCKVRAYTVVADEKAKDAKASLDAASILGIDHILIMPSKEEIIDAVERIGSLSNIRDMFTLSILLPLWFVLLKAGEKVILDGQGADELFGGYARYLRMGKEELASALQSDPRKAIELSNKEDVLARKLDKELHHPFLSDQIVKFALSLQPEKKVANGSRKIILREAGSELGLHATITNREKRAAQYGSGMEKALKRLGGFA
jgi:asparagine synthase (glutamine-hydrolysing)